MKKHILKIIIVFTAIAAIVSCKQRVQEPKSILRLRSITLNGIAPSEADLKSGAAKVIYEKNSFLLKIDAELLNVKVFIKNKGAQGGEAVDITSKVINKEPVTVSVKKTENFSITFSHEGKILTEYKFTAEPASSAPGGDNKVRLISLTLNGQSVEIKDGMRAEIKSASDRVAVKAETDIPAKLFFTPELSDGKIHAPLNEETELSLTIVGSGGFSKTYKLFIKNINITESENGMGLKSLKINGKKVPSLKGNIDVSAEYEAPSMISVEAEAFNNADVKFEPPLLNGKMPLGFGGYKAALIITVEKEGFAPSVYNVSVTRAKKKAELRSLTVNGHLLEINEEMHVSVSYERDKAVINAVGKKDTQIAFDPPLISEAVALAEGENKDVTITVSGAGMESSVYVLKLQRKNQPAPSSPSSLESVKIAAGHNKRINFREIDKDFPSVKDYTNYEVRGANEFTLRLEKLSIGDTIEVRDPDNKLIPADTKALDPSGLGIYYNISVNVEIEKSTRHLFKISVQQSGMQKRDLSLVLCYDGALAEAVYMLAEYDNTKVIPSLNRINFIPENTDVKVTIQPADSASSVKTKDGASFPVTISVGNEEKVLEFELTTISGRKVFNKLTFKTAEEEERAVIDFINFYPEKVTPGPGNTLGMYKKKLSPGFSSDIAEYVLELIPGTRKLFFDAKGIIKSAEINASYKGVNVGREVYYRHPNGSDTIEMFAFDVSPNETGTLSITAVSDKDSSIQKTYNITIVSPDDDTVTDFDIEFFTESKEQMLIIPAVGKGGLRLPPQDHNVNSFNFKILSKADGITYKIVHAKIEYDSNGAPSYIPVKPVTLNGETGTVNGLTAGMNAVIIEASARDGKTKTVTVYEAYKFTKENKVSFEFNGNTIEPKHYQERAGAMNLPLRIKGLGTDVRFAVTALDKDFAGFKVNRISDTEFEITQKAPYVVMIGAIMPDNARLFYAIFTQ